MAFGNPVTDFDQQAIGDYGYIVKIDAVSLLALEVDAVQAQASASSTPSPVTAETTRNAIEGYLNDSACPDLAFNFSGSDVLVFFKTSVFAYASDTRIALFGKRFAQNVSDDATKMDILDDDIALLLAYMMQLAALSLKNTKLKYIEDWVETEEKKITG